LKMAVNDKCVCFRWLESDKSGMAVIEVKLVSGFIPDEDTLERVNSMFYYCIYTLLQNAILCYTLWSCTAHKTSVDVFVAIISYIMFYLMMDTNINQKFISGLKRVARFDAPEHSN